jgi:hypothetical protein
MMCFLALLSVVEIYDWKSILIFTLLSGITTNQRIMGVLFPTIAGVLITKMHM